MPETQWMGYGVGGYAIIGAYQRKRPHPADDTDMFAHSDSANDNLADDKTQQFCPNT